MSLIALFFSLSLGALPPAQTASNEFVFANENEPESLDPHFASGVPDNTVIQQMFEGLMSYQANWVSLEPGQAASEPKVSKDGRVYTFTLREGLKWSDGSALTAEDFRWSWLRAMRPSTGGPYSYWLTDHIKGAKAYAAQPNAKTEKQVGLAAPDARTFVVTLDKPVPYFIQLTADSVMMPVKRSVIEKFGDQWTRPANIVSNGAFRMKEWRVNEKIVLEKNPHFRDAKKVQIERVVALPINNKMTAVNLFRQGRLDWTGHQGAPNAQVAGFRKDDHFHVTPSFITYFYRFNTTRPPLDDVRVRQALSLAIDRKTLVEKVTRGGESVATALVPPKTGDYVSPSGIISDDYQRNLKRAKELLAEAGYPNGEGMRELLLQYDTKDLHKKVAIAIQSMWKQNLGVRIKPLNQEWKVYLARQRKMDFDISRSGWQGDYPDPATFLELFTSTSGNSHTGFANEDYDQYFRASSNELDPQKRRELMVKAEEVLLNELPIMPLFYYTNFSFLRPEIQGFVYNLADRPFVRFYSKK